MRLPQLGWRNSRPNEFQGPDARPLSDQFVDIQKFMTWPHFQAVIEPGVAIAAAFTAKVLTPTIDPFQLLTVSTRIQVPRDFDSWWFVGYAHVFMAASGVAGTHNVGWMLNGATQNNYLGSFYTPSAAATRTFIHSQQPLNKSDYLQVGVSAPAATTVTSAVVSGYFLPYV